MQNENQPNEPNNIVSPQDDRQQPGPDTSNVVPIVLGSDFAPSEPKRQFYKNPIYVGTILVAVALVLIASFAMVYKSNFKAHPVETQSRLAQKKSKSPTDLERKLANYPEELSKLRAFSLPIYIPASYSVSKAVIGESTTGGIKKQFVGYGINPQFGQGLVPGSYAVNIFSIDQDFVPPNDCGSPAGGKLASPILCTRYEGSTEEMPAYIYRGILLPTITNTDYDPSTYLTLYVKRGNEVITVQTSGSSPDELYAMVKAMVLIDPVDLPEDTLVSFY